MTDRPDTVSSEDIRKCGEEIKQLRNQQFILATTALGLFGAYAALLPRFSQLSPAPNPGVFIWSAVAIILVFLLLFIWTRQLRVLIGVLSVWLELVGQSAWEHDFRKYHAAHTPVSQTKLESLTFLLIGLSVPGLVLMVTPMAEHEVACWLWVVLAVVDVLYLGAVVVFGMLKLGINDERVRTNWTAILGAGVVPVRAQDTTGGPQPSPALQPPDDAPAVAS